jgi:hypothetical protein
VCKALRDAYGCLQVSVTDKQFVDVATTPPTSLARATTLELRSTPWEVSASLALGLIAHACPSLESLSLLINSGASDNQTITDDGLGTLAPLASTLTALLINPGGPSRLESIQALQQLTRLRELQLHCVEPVVGCQPPEAGTMSDGHYAAELESLQSEAAWLTLQRQAAWLRALSGMHQLVHLSLFDSPVSFCARGWLPGLARAMPQLTSLRLGSATTWDEEATAALLEGLPSLQAFSAVINLRDFLQQNEATARSSAAMVAALVRRSGLQSLDLTVFYGSGAAADALHQLPALQLSAFSPYDAAEHSELVARVLEAQTGLTRLLMHHCRAPRDLLSAPAIAALASTLVELRALGPCDPAALMACVAQLPCVRLLELNVGPCQRRQDPPCPWTPAATSMLGTLTQLTMLAMEERRLPAQLLPALARLTRLRSLQLMESFSLSVIPDAPTVHDADLAHLAPLRAQLTRLELQYIYGVRGPGLAVMRHMGCLKQLVLDLPDLLVGELHLHLLPPPPDLTCLKVSSSRSLPGGVCAALMGALGPLQCSLWTLRAD